MVTLFQLFFIGFTFGISGPCLLTCTPIIITYLAGAEKKFASSIKNIAIFLAGRFFVYIAMGAMAGLSGAILRRFLDSGAAVFFKPLAGAISIVLGVIILVRRTPLEKRCQSSNFKRGTYGGLFMLGVSLGIAPCAPLTMLLFNIMLMSRSIWDGILYGAFFGLGTFLSSLIVVGVISGAIGFIPSKILRSERSNLIFRVICALLLIILGLSLIILR